MAASNHPVNLVHPRPSVVDKIPAKTRMIRPIRGLLF